MLFIQSKNTDPYYNLSLEEYIFNNYQEDVFMLWQNQNAIVIGNYQNTVEEINTGYVNENDIKVVRRLSGGGAVYHDLGNINFTFITKNDSNNVFCFKHFTQIIIDVIGKFGVLAEFKGRNDLLVSGKKFSGNSQYIKGNRLLHHGTILYNSDLDVIAKALNVDSTKFESKSVKSVRQRVSNISEFMKDVSSPQFCSALKDHIFLNDDVKEYFITQNDEEQIIKLRNEKYKTWEWNYGKSPKYNMHKKGKCDGGTLEVFLSIEKGYIKSAEIKGDFFANENFHKCVESLINLRFFEVEAKLVVEDISDCISNVEKEWLHSLIFF